MKNIHLSLIALATSALSTFSALACSPCVTTCVQGNAIAKHIMYKVNGTPVTYLKGSITPGATVEVDFSTDPGTDSTRFSFVTYTAPSPVYNAATANQQQVYDLQEKLFGPGQHSMIVKVPNCNYQIDLVYGCVIQHLGPQGTNNFYSAQNRLIQSINGGNKVCMNMNSCVQGNGVVQNLDYMINGSDVASLSSGIVSGSSVQVFFTIPDGSTPTRVSFVSYKGGSSDASVNSANPATVFDSSTALLAPGCHTMTINVPNCYYQVALVYGCIANPLTQNSQAYYSGQNRLIDYANGGNASCNVDTTACDTCGGTNGFPVKLVKFDAKKIQQNQVQLSWTTASEMNNNYIAIEKSTDVNTWQEVCRVAGYGTSNTTHNYSCVDKHADESGQNNVYYRPKQVDFNGTYEYFNMIRIRLQDISSQTSINNVYPNPATDNRIHVAYNATENSVFNITLTSLDGKRLLTNTYIAQPGSQVMDLNLPETVLKSGFYILEVQSDDVVYRQKIYKQ